MSDLHPRAAAALAEIENEKPQSEAFSGDLEAWRTATIWYAAAGLKILARHLSDAYDALYCRRCGGPMSAGECGSCWTDVALHEEREEMRHE